MITLDANIQSAGTERLSLLPEHSIQVNESLYQIEDVDIAAIGNPPVEELLRTEVFANEHTVRAPVTIKEWAPALEHEFQGLAEKEALDEAAAEKLHRLEELSILRGRFRANMSAEQIFFLHNLQKKQDKLLNELSDYVSFIKASHC